MWQGKIFTNEVLEGALLLHRQDNVNQEMSQSTGLEAKK